jgi:hypothetical protein
MGHEEMALNESIDPIARCITKSVAIKCPPQRAFQFLADGANWPRWAFVNIKSTTKAEDPQCWDMTTVHGRARLRIRAVAEYGILDHDYDDPQARWTVPARVLPNGQGTEFIMTFFQPAAFTDEFFDKQIKLVDVELAELKHILEREASA